MLIEIEHGNEVCILRLSGHLRTGENTDYIRETANEITTRECNRMIGDFRELQSIGSMGIGFIVGAYVSVTKRSGGHFVLVGANERVQGVLDLTRLSTIIPLAEDLASGLAVLRNEGPIGRSAGQG